MAVAEIHYGWIPFLIGIALIFLGGALNVFGGLRHGIVFQRSRDVTKSDEPITYGFLLGVSTLMVVSIGIASIMVLMTRNWE